MTSLEIITLGCRLNIAESEAIRQQLADDCDVVVVNSCAVTNEAVRQTRKAIRRARRQRPDSRIVVTGCAAQTEPGLFAAMPEVSHVIGNGEKPQLATLIASDEPVRVADIMTVRQQAPQLVSAFAERVRAFVPVQNGCDHRCTFCIIPFGRGPSRSVPAGAVIDQISRLVDEGVQEVVLTGVDVTSYGPDLPGAPTLGALIERILTRVPLLSRLRLSSLDGVEMDGKLLELLTSERRVMPHVHLSLQAGDDLILKRMKRRHSRADAIKIVAQLIERRPEIAVGADIIAGFPTEDDAAFRRSVDLIQDCRIVHGHIFPFSPREGTPAARMPQVNPAIIRDRASHLREESARSRLHWLKSLIGTRQNVLVETGGTAGHAENFAPVRFKRPRPAGAIVTAFIESLEDGALIAQEQNHV